MDIKDLQRITQFLFEVGTLRKLNRSHRQLLLTDDMSDNIAAHSFRAIVIGYFLARMESVSAEKVMIMLFTHDVGEARTNDHNWLHKRYVAEAEDEITSEQLGTLPFPELFNVATEYSERLTPEAIVAKDADLIDQILLLREYAHQGNQEAKRWLEGKRTKRPYSYVERLKTESAKALGRAIYDEEPSSWWNNLYTSERRRL